MPLIIALWLLSQPLVVQAPINGLLTERLITIQGNSVVGVTSHLNPSYSNSLGVLGDFTDKVVILHELELAAQKYGLNEKRFIKLAICESSLNPEAKGESGEFGIFQFKKRTFNNYCQGEWKNMEDQIQCAGQMISRGLSFHWVCKY